MATIPNAEHGVAGFQSDQFNGPVELFANDTPLVVTDYGTLTTAQGNTGLAKWTPVFVDPGTREVKLAVIGSADPADDVHPNAITQVTIAANSGATNVQVYKAGTFNIKALNWPASFDTDAKKFAAFAQATDAQIYIKAPFYG